MFTFIRFGLIGLLNTAIDFGVFNLLIVLFGLSASDSSRYAIFKSISFTVAVIHSFFLNKHWVFKNKTSINTHQVGKFFAINIVGLVINTLIGSSIFALTSNNSLFSPHAWANISALCAVALTFTFNFLAYKFIVFKH